MRIVLCYVAVTNGPKTSDLASRFVSTYHNFPPGVPHDTLVICQGGPLATEIGLLFASLKARFWVRKNDPGWDISAYIEAASGPCEFFDMMLCFGESVHFHRAGWLKRFVEAWDKHGPGFYGAFSSNVIRAHLQTTAFCISPALLRMSPFKPHDRKTRYAWEHGRNAFWRFVEAKRFPVRLVTWEAEWTPRHWRAPQNILWRGDQSNCLLRCKHTDTWDAARLEWKRKWSALADSPFQ